MAFLETTSSVLAVATLGFLLGLFDLLFARLFHLSHQFGMARPFDIAFFRLPISFGAQVGATTAGLVRAPASSAASSITAYCTCAIEIVRRTEITG